MATLEEVEAELQRREQLAAVEAELQRRAAPAPAPDPAEPVAPVAPPRGQAITAPAFAPPTAAQTDADVQRLVDEEMQLRGATLTPAQRERARTFTAARVRRELQAEYGDVLTQAAPPEAQEAFRTRTPALRPSEVQYVPAFRTAAEVIEEQGPVSPEVLDLEMAKFPTPLREAERRAVVPQIYDREQGAYRFPTAVEELREAYARQPRMTEAEAQARGAQLRADPAEAFPLQGVITERLGGRGTYETELGASLRGPLGTLSATLGDLFFRGLGYEVAKDAEGNTVLDEQGNEKPKDINDFGYQVAQLRRAVGLPETVAASIGGAGFVPVPLPGVATDPSILFEYDPKGVRAPSPEPQTLRRLARHVASGRSIGDEFAQSPALRKAYADLYGDPDSAFWGGTLLDIYMPTGIGAIARGGATATKVLGDKAPKAARFLLEQAARGMETEAAEKVLRHVRRSGAVQDTRTGGGLPQAVADALIPSPQRLRAAARQVDVLDAVIDPQGPTDPRLMRAVAERLVPTLGLEAEAEAAAITAVRSSQATSGAALVDEVGEALELVAGSPQAQAYARAVDLRTPADLVMVTPRTAVPRAIADDVRSAVREEVRRVFEGAPASEREPTTLRELIDLQADSLRRWAAGDDVPMVRLSNEELAARLADTPLADRYPARLLQQIERDGFDSLPAEVQGRIIEDYADIVARRRTRVIVEDYAIGQHVTLTPRERANLERALSAIGQEAGEADVPQFVARTIADAPKAGTDDSLVSFLVQGSARDVQAAQAAEAAGELEEAARLQRRAGSAQAAARDLQTRADKARTAAAGLDWRDANAVSDAQVYLDELNDRALFDSPTLRRLVSVYGDPNQPYYRASVTEMQREVQTIGQGVLRRLGADLKARVEGTGAFEGNARTYDEALDSLLVDSLEALEPAVAGSAAPTRYKTVKRQAAAQAVIDGIPENVRTGWLRNADRAYKPAIAEAIDEDQALREATLNLLHQQYQIKTGSKVPFDEFLDAPLTLYRAGIADKGEPFVSYSYDAAMAEKFASQYGVPVQSITIRPRDTYGMINEMAEGEVLVPMLTEHSAKFKPGEQLTVRGKPWTVERRAARQVYLRSPDRPASAAPMKIAEDKLSRLVDDYSAPGEAVPDLDTQGVWAAILGEMYDPSRVEKVLRGKVARIIVDSDGGLRVVDEVKAGDRLVIDDLPTMQRLRQLDTLLAGAGDVPRGRPPSFDRAMLKMSVEEGVRKRLGRGARERAARRFGAPEAPEQPGQVSVPFDEAEALRDPRFSEYAWTIDRANNPEEVALLQEVDSAVRLFDDVEVRQRGNVANLAGYYGDKLARGVRDSLHSLNYGVSVVPNPLTVTSRAGVSGMLMLSQMGAQRALEAAGRSVSRANPLAGRRVGRGITSVDGRAYSPAELEELWKQSGGATTAIDAARRGSLAEDLLIDAKRASERVHGKGSTDRGRLRKVYDLATNRGYWQSQAEAAELSFRRSVFELALSDGASPAEAGELARTAVIDYAGSAQALDSIVGAIPGADGMPKYFASAAEDAALAREAVAALGRNPQTVRAVVQAQRAQQRAYDPEQLYGDAGLKSLGIMPVPVSKTGEQTLVFGPQNPMYIPVEHTLGVLRSADAGLSGVADALAYVEALEGAGAFETAAYLGPEVSGAAAEALAETGGTVSRAALTRYLPGVLEAYNATSEVDPGELTRTGLPAVDADERALWTAYLYADLADPIGQYGIKAGVDRLLEPQVVTPPEDLAVPVAGFEDFWSEEPANGLPFIYVGQEPSTGAHLWQSFEISARGKRNLEAIRAASVEDLAQAFGLPGAILAGESQRVQAGPVYPVTGTTGALAEFLGTVAPPAAAVRAETARTIAEARGAQ